MAEVGTHVLIERLRRVAHHHGAAHSHALAAGQAHRQPATGAVAPESKPGTGTAVPHG